MAKTYKQPSIVSGMTIEDILNMDSKVFNQLSLSDLRKITGRLVSAGNKRLRSLAAKGHPTPAYLSVQASGGMFSIAGKDRTAIKNEFQRAKHFLQLKTSSVRGWEKVKKETIKSLNQKGVKVSDADFSVMIQTYVKIKEMNPAVAHTVGSPPIFKEIRNVMVERGIDNPDTLATIVADKLDELYEQNAQTENAADVSSFFEI